MTAATIPVENLYYLLCYAWNRLEERDLVDISAVDQKDLPNLAARILISGTRHLFKLGLDREYQEHGEDTSSLRGKIDFGESIKRLLFEIPRAHCRLDDLSHDVTHNQILKATLYGLSKCSDIAADHRHATHHLARQMTMVSDIRLTHGIFSRVRLHRNIAFYGFLIDVCELVFDALLPEEKSGERRFREFFRDEDLMWRVFQDFVFNFYRLEQDAFSVSARKISWDLRSASPYARAFLPEMNTDITLTQKGRIVVIDTKYYKEAFQSYKGKFSVRSDHLFQIQAYVSNLAAMEVESAVEGILLYPTVDYELSLEYDISGHRIRLQTIDLAKPWPFIEKELRDLPAGSDDTVSANSHC